LVGGARRRQLQIISRHGGYIIVKLAYQGVIIKVIAPGCFQKRIAGRFIAAKKQMALTNMIPER